MQIIYQPLLNLIIVFYHLLFSNLGLAIIAFTVFMKLVLTPLTLPSMKMMQKIKDHNPELERIKKKYKDDKQKQLQAQTDFYKEKGINPASGCLPQIVNFVILIALFNGFSTVFRTSDVTASLNQILYPSLRISGEVNKYFLGQDLTRPDVIAVSVVPFPLPGLFLVFVALLQFLSSKMMLPEVKKLEKVAKATTEVSDDMAVSMQKQMIYMFPLITLVVGLSFPLSIVLFWGALSLFQGVQQYFVSGWGGLAPYVRRLKLSS